MSINLHGRVYGELHEVHRAFVAYPELRPHFFHGEPLPKPDADESAKLTDYYRARGIAEMFFDVFEYVWVVKGEMSPRVLGELKSADNYFDENWKKYIDGMLKDSHFLSSYLCEVNQAIYPQDLRRFVLERIDLHWDDIRVPDVF